MTLRCGVGLPPRKDMPRPGGDSVFRVGGVLRCCNFKRDFGLLFTCQVCEVLSKSVFEAVVLHTRNGNRNRIKID